MIAGGGNPTGGSFTGPAQALEIIGNHAYAYSGIITAGTVQDAETTYLDFTTGSAYTAVRLQWYTDAASSDNFQLKVKMNGTTILTSEVFSITANDPAGYTPIELIIPAYTQFEVTIANTQASNARDSAVILTGRIYRR